MGMGPGWRTSTGWVLPSRRIERHSGLALRLFRTASRSPSDGVHGQVAFRTTFGAVPPALVTTPAGFFDDGVYDDPFASDAISGQGGFTRAFKSGAELEAIVNYADRRYTSTPALDAGGNEQPGSPLRSDRVWRGAPLEPVFGSHKAERRWIRTASSRRVRTIFYDYTSHGHPGFSVHY
jgi:hypothetical protein